MMEGKDIGRKVGMVIRLCSVPAVLVAFVWWTFTLKPIDDGNPNIPRTANQIARAEVASVEIAEHERREHYWIKQIEAGNGSFSEAACELEKHGEWDDVNSRCQPHETPLLNQP